jgi:hypothetical protein
MRIMIIWAGIAPPPLTMGGTIIRTVHVPEIITRIIHGISLGLLTTTHGTIHSLKGTHDPRHQIMLNIVII